MKYQKPEMANMSQLLMGNSSDNIESAATIAILVAVVVVWVALTE